ncbi:MAG TPA: YdeI/OmpD-associated family protein [Actinomycetes bacterium]|nr:YdeI/OmpD-associated family protein [Actinomycetes bacterium]
MTAPRFFARPADLAAWFAEHASSEPELLVGYWRKGTGKPSITWPESVDEALCVGWIDGIRRRIDDESYSIRFTPRRTGSTWSAVNVRRVGELTAAGRMQEAGLAAFAARRAGRSGTYSHEQSAEPRLDADAERVFRADREGWAFFTAQPPSYRRAAVWWVVSAKRAETRDRRLAQLVADSHAGLRIALLRR